MLSSALEQKDRELTVLKDVTALKGEKAALQAELASTANILAAEQDHVSQLKNSLQLAADERTHLNELKQSLDSQLQSQQRDMDALQRLLQQHEVSRSASLSQLDAVIEEKQALQAKFQEALTANKALESRLAAKLAATAAERAEMHQKQLQSEDALQARIAMLLARTQQLETDYLTLDNTRQTTETDLRRQIRALQDQLAALRKQNATAEAASADKIALLQTAKADLDKQFEDLSQQKAAAEASLTRQIWDLTDQQTQAAKLRSQAEAALRGQLGEATAEKRTLAARLQQAEESDTATKKLIAALNEQLEALRRSGSESALSLQARIDALLADLKRAEATAQQQDTAHRKREAELQAQIRKLAEDASAAAAERASLEAELGAKIAALESEKAKLQQELAQLEARRVASESSSQKQVQALKEQLDTLQQNNLATESSLRAQIQAAADKLQALLGSSTETEAQLRSQLESMASERHALQAQQTQLSAAKSQLQEELTAQIKNLTEQLAAASRSGAATESALHTQLAALTADKSELDAVHQRLEARFRDLTAQHTLLTETAAATEATLRSQLQTLNEQFTALSGTSSSTEGRLRSEMDAVVSEKNALAEQLQQLQSARKLMEEDLLAQCQALNDKLRKQRHVAAMTEAALRSKNATLTSDKADAGGKLQALELRFKELTEQHGDLRDKSAAEHAAAHTKIQGLEARLAQQSAAAAADAARAQADIGALTSERNERVKAHEQLTAAKMAMYKEMSAQISSLKDRLSDLEQSSAQTEAQLRAQIGELTKKLATLSESSANAESKLTADLESLTQAKELLSTELSGRIKAITEEHATLKQASADTEKSLSAKIDELTAERAQLQAECASLKAAGAELSEKFNDLTNQHEALLQTEADLREKLGALTHQRDSLLAEIATLKARVAELEAMLAISVYRDFHEGVVAELQKQLAAETALLATRTGELEAARATIADLERRLAQALATIAEMQEAERQRIAREEQAEREREERTRRSVQGSKCFALGDFWGAVTIAGKAAAVADAPANDPRFLPNRVLVQLVSVGGDEFKTSPDKSVQCRIEAWAEPYDATQRAFTPIAGFSSACESDPSNRIPAQFKDEKDGTFTVAYDVPEEGKYNVYINVNGEPIRDSPRAVLVASTSRHCTATGAGVDGVRDLVLPSTAAFSVQAASALGAIGCPGAQWQVDVKFMADPRSLAVRKLHEAHANAAKSDGHEESAAPAAASTANSGDSKPDNMLAHASGSRYNWNRVSVTTVNSLSVKGLPAEGGDAGAGGKEVKLSSAGAIELLDPDQPPIWAVSYPNVTVAVDVPTQPPEVAALPSPQPSAARKPASRGPASPTAAASAAAASVATPPAPASVPSTIMCTYLHSGLYQIEIPLAPTVGAPGMLGIYFISVRGTDGEHVQGSPFRIFHGAESLWEEKLQYELSDVVGRTRLEPDKQFLLSLCSQPMSKEMTDLMSANEAMLKKIFDVYTRANKLKTTRKGNSFEMQQLANESLDLREFNYFCTDYNITSLVSPADCKTIYRKSHVGNDKSRETLIFPYFVAAILRLSVMTYYAGEEILAEATITEAIQQMELADRTADAKKQASFKQIACMNRLHRAVSLLLNHLKLTNQQFTKGGKKRMHEKNF